MPIRFTIPPISLPRSGPDDPRIGHLLGRQAADGAEPLAALIGFPSDEGVRRNRGRPGAAEGPDAIRRTFYRLTPEPDTRFRELIERSRDLGNLALTGSLEDDQAVLGEVVSHCLTAGTVPIVLGGGHETALGHFLGYVEAEIDASILNWDAHADVRPLIDGRGHSGSPFRQALLHGSHRCREYIVAGLLPHAVSSIHLAFVREHGTYHWRHDLSPRVIDEIYAALKGDVMVSFDLDALDQSHAPGVSAPAAGGLPLDLWLHAASGAGRRSAVRSMDLVELNPAQDVDHGTARVAALTLWHFFKGLAARATT
jgi:formiminoglutamase